MSSVFHGITAGRAFGKPGPFIGSAAAAPPSTLLTGLVSWWKLDEESGVRYDAVGSNDLTDNNTVGFSTGLVGNAAHTIDGNAEGLTASITMDPSSYTFAGWVKMPNAEGNGIPFDITGVFYTWPSIGQVYVFAAPGGLLGTPPPADGAWHLLTVWQDGTTSGVQLDDGAPATDTRTPVASGTKNLLFPNKSFDLTCDIDEIGIWNRPLSASERAALYAAGAGRYYDFQV